MDDLGNLIALLECDDPLTEIFNCILRDVRRSPQANSPAAYLLCALLNELSHGLNGGAQPPQPRPPHGERPLHCERSCQPCQPCEPCGPCTACEERSAQPSVQPTEKPCAQSAVQSIEQPVQPDILSPLGDLPPREIEVALKRLICADRRAIM